MSLSLSGRLLGLCLFCFAAPLSADPASLPPDRTLAEGSPQPAVWLLSDGDTRIWLFGTTHVLPHDYAWRSPELDAIIAEADELVMETLNEDGTIDEQETFEMMQAETPRPILERISREYRMPLRTMLKAWDMQPSALDGLDTWAAGFLLMGVASFRDVEDYGLGPGGEPTGVEIQLSAIFAEQGKPISAVETAREQVTFFDTLTEDAQRAFLESMIGDGGETAEPPSDSVWREGDVEALGANCDEEIGASSELFDVVLRRRNAAWVEWLIDRLERPGDILFAVGACHLAGAASVQVLLAERGITVERIE